MKTCNKCGHENEQDANFCRECGTSLSVSDKDQVEFVAGKRQTEGDFLCFGEDTRSESGSLVIGIVFIVIAILAAIAMFTTFFSDFGSSIGSIAGGFGETMGQIGSDLGEFFGNWGDNFGNAVGTFFSGTAWWDIIKPLIVLLFLIIGIILIATGRRRK